MQITITALYAGILAVVYVALSYLVTTHRHRTKTGLGMGEDDGLQRAVRVHANFAEYVPLALLLLALVEGMQAPGWSVHLFGSALLVARLLHGMGLSRSSGASRGRWWGTALTFSVILFLGLTNLLLFGLSLS